MNEMPTIFRDNRGNEFFVIEKHVPVFNVEQARIVFQYYIPGLHVWGMKPPVTNLLLSIQQAIEFFDAPSGVVVREEEKK